MEEKYNRNLYKVFLILLKYMPFLIAVIYFICTILGAIGINQVILPNLFFLSPVTAALWICASFVFKCCIWHRLPIYYCLMMQGIDIIDYYTDIGLSSNCWLFVYLIITIISILLGMYLKNMFNVRKWSKVRAS